MKSKHLSPSPCFKSFIPSLHWQSYGYWLRYLQHKGILITHACTQPYIPDELGWKKSKSIRRGRTSEPPQKHASTHSKKALQRAVDMGGVDDMERTLWHGDKGREKKPCTEKIRWGPPLPPSEMDRAGFLPVWQSEGCVVRFYSDAPVLLVNQPSLLSPGRPMVTHHRCHPYMTLGKKKRKPTRAHTQANTRTSILYNVPHLSQWHGSKQAKVAEWRDHRANEWQLASKHGGLVLRRAADNHLIFLTEMFHSEKCPPASHLTLTEGVQCRVSHE